MFLFNQLNLFVANNTVPHFKPIIARLLDFMNCPDVDLKLPACMTLTTYAKHCVNLQHSQFFKPMLENVLPFIYDSDISVQKQGCLAILELNVFFGESLQNYVHTLNFFVKRAFRQNSNNSASLYRVQNLVRRYID